MLRLLILLLASTTTASWVPVGSQFSSTTALYVRASHDNECEACHNMPRRRRVLNSAFSILAFVVPCASLASSEDPLDSFGKQLSSSGAAGKMPATPQSAVNVNSAVTPTPPTSYSDGGNAANLQQAIDESLKKKRIDPRTHG
jgi:hypothetical protein